MKLVGVLGGTFDPVHIGHLRAAVELRESLQLDHVRLIPCGQPPHRAPPTAAAEQRLRLLQLAISGEQGLAVDDVEIRSTGPSYSVNTLLRLRDALPDTGFCLALGLDAFRSLHTWYHWQQLFELAHIVVMHRPGWDKDQVLRELDVSAHKEVTARLHAGMQSLHKVAAGSVCFLPVTGMDISSTHIRDLVRAGNSIRYLVPDSIVADVRVLYSN